MSSEGGSFVPREGFSLQEARRLERFLAPQEKLTPQEKLQVPFWHLQRSLDSLEGLVGHPQRNISLSSGIKEFQRYYGKRHRRTILESEARLRARANTAIGTSEWAPFSKTWPKYLKQWKPVREKLLSDMKEWEDKANTIFPLAALDTLFQALPIPRTLETNTYRYDLAAEYTALRSAVMQVHTLIERFMSEQDPRKSNDPRMFTPLTSAFLEVQKKLRPLTGHLAEFKKVYATFLATQPAERKVVYPSFEQIFALGDRKRDADASTNALTALEGIKKLAQVSSLKKTLTMRKSSLSRFARFHTYADDALAVRAGLDEFGGKIAEAYHVNEIVYNALNALLTYEETSMKMPSAERPTLDERYAYFTKTLANMPGLTPTLRTELVRALTQKSGPKATPQRTYTQFLRTVKEYRNRYGKVLRTLFNAQKTGWRVKDAPLLQPTTTTRH